MMHSTRSLIACTSLAAVVGLVTSPGAQAASTEQKQMADQIQALRDQVEALQRRLDAQSAAERQTKDEASAAEAQAAAAKADAASAKSAVAAIPTEIHTAVDAAKPKTDKIYYKGLGVTLGGFLAAEYVYRQHNETNDISTSFSAIPYANNPAGQTNELRFTARQSRVSALVQGDANKDTHLAFYTELDFQGAAQTANSNESNSYNPRLRHLYGTMDWDDLSLHFLAGQTWSLTTMNGKGITPRNEVPPPTIDGQYIPGFTWTRQPQVRLTKDFDKQLWLAVSLENPATTSYAGANAFPATVHLTSTAAGGAGFNSVNTLSLNHLPDVVAKVAFESTVADRAVHLEAYGLYRSFYERLNYSNQNVSGGGFGAAINVSLVPKILDFQVAGLAGKGIGRYGSAQLTDVTFDAAGVIHPISEVQALAGFTLHPVPALDVYLFAGEEKESAQSYTLTPTTGAPVQYGYGNALYSNTGCFSETAPGACVGNTRLIEQVTTGFWYRPYQGTFGRIQYGLQYSWTERQAFSGVGGAPSANQNIVLASFRYYPF